MADPVFLSRSDPQTAASQLFGKLRGTYTYHCRTLHEDCPFITEPEQALYAASDLTRTIHGTTAFEIMFPAEEYTQLLMISHIQLYRNPPDLPGVEQKEKEEHAEHVERFVLRQNFETSAFSLWRYVPRDSRTELQEIGPLQMRAHSVDGEGQMSRQRVTLICERGYEQMVDEGDAEWFPWRVLQINLFLGPGVEHAIPGKKPGMEISWIGQRWMVPAVYGPDGEREWEFWACRVEELRPTDEVWEKKWIGDGRRHSHGRLLDVDRKKRTA